MTLNFICLDLVGHSPIAGLTKCNLTDICATFCTVSTDTMRRMAIAELLVLTMLCLWDGHFSLILKLLPECFSSTFLMSGELWWTAQHLLHDLAYPFLQSDCMLLAYCRRLWTCCHRRTFRQTFKHLVVLLLDVTQDKMLSSCFKILRFYISATVSKV